MDIDVESGFQPHSHHTELKDRLVVASLAQKSEAKVVVEVGCWVGQTTIALAKACPDAQIFCVDPFTGNPEDRLGEVAAEMGPDLVRDGFCRNVKKYLHTRVHPLVGTSASWALRWTIPIDICFLDAQHDYDSVIEDICAWEPHVRRGGIICGHDYNSFPGVREAVIKLYPDQHSSEENVWWHQRRKD